MAKRSQETFKLVSRNTELLYIRVIHVLWSWKGFERPVKEAVDEDQTGTASPNQQNRNKVNTKIVDHLTDKQLSI